MIDLITHRINNVIVVPVNIVLSIYAFQCSLYQNKSRHFLGKAMLELN